MTAKMHGVSHEAAISPELVIFLAEWNVHFWIIQVNEAISSHYP